VGLSVGRCLEIFSGSTEEVLVKSLAALKVSIESKIPRDPGEFPDNVFELIGNRDSDNLE
jgi:hypothetical protein